MNSMMAMATNMMTNMMSGERVLNVRILELTGGPEYCSFCDKTDPYIKITLHGGQYEDLKCHGDHSKTSYKTDAGGKATFNETITLLTTPNSTKVKNEFLGKEIDMPIPMTTVRVELKDHNTILPNELLGYCDVSLSEIVLATTGPPPAVAGGSWFGFGSKGATPAEAPASDGKEEATRWVERSLPMMKDGKLVGNVAVKFAFTQKKPDPKP